jgi:hypothetical protein
VGRRQGADRLTLLSEKTSNGARAVLVFEEEEEAAAFLILEDLGPQWEVLEKAEREAADLLLICASGGIRYVALNPPSVLTRRHEGHPLIPIRAFVDGLTEG